MADKDKKLVVGHGRFDAYPQKGEFAKEYYDRCQPQIIKNKLLKTAPNACCIKTLEEMRNWWESQPSRDPESDVSWQDWVKWLKLGDELIRVPDDLKIRQKPEGMG